MRLYPPILALALSLAMPVGATDPVVVPIFGFTSGDAASHGAENDSIWIEGRQNAPVIAHFIHGLEDLAWMRGSRFVHNYPFIYAIYDDGLAIFSDDPVVGGPPYRARQLNSAEQAVVHQVADQIMAAPNARRTYGGGDWKGHRVSVFRGYSRDLRSTHLLMEAGEERRWLATSGGYIEPNGRCFSDIAAGEPASFIAYRDAWKAALDLRGLFDAEASEPMEVTGSDRRLVNASGGFGRPDIDSDVRFAEKRARRADFAATGDTVSITELRGHFASNYVNFYPWGPCE